jgi:hypothetical protein
MERKKIVPKAKLDASKQEELLKKLQQNTEAAVIVQQPVKETATAQKEVVKETVKLQQNTATTVNSSNDTEKSTKIQRITVDMPIDLYERMKNEVDDNGQTIKGFVVNLVRAHFKRVG